MNARGISNYDLQILKDESEDLQTFANSAWTGSLDDSKSISGYVFDW